MLRHLHIQNFVLIEDTALDFDGGFTVITGETGSGKSLLLEALALLGGMRASPTLVRSGTDRAIIEAVFEIPGGGPADLLLRGLGLEPASPGEVLLRREIHASGRGRAAVNGRLVPLAQLTEVAEELFEFCAQHDQHRLLRPTAQRDLYDVFLGLESHRSSTELAYRELEAADRALEDLLSQDRDREQRRDFLRFQSAELDELAFREGELEELETDCRRLGHLEELIEHGACASSVLTESEGDSPAASDLVGKAIRSVESMTGHDESLLPALELLREAQDRLNEASFALSRYVEGLEADPERLDKAHGRAAALRAGLRKYGPSESEALSRREAVRTELDQIENWEGSIAEAEGRSRAAQAKLKSAAADLSAGRRKSRGRLVKSIATLLKDFAMPAVRVDVAFRPVSVGRLVDGEGTLCGTAGLEDIEIIFSANEGEEPQPLRRVASGGELSRFMLALRTLGAQWSEMPVLIFDEVDAGISGLAARCVAERLAALGERSQVLCVTHNAAAASAANHHIVLEKQTARGRTRTVAFHADGVRRQAELARLLDGGKGSDKGMALAAEMLQATA